MYKTLINLLNILIIPIWVVFIVLALNYFNFPGILTFFIYLALLTALFGLFLKFVEGHKANNDLQHEREEIYKLIALLSTKNVVNKEVSEVIREYGLKVNYERIVSLGKHSLKTNKM